MLKIIEIESVQATAKGVRPTPAHIKIVGEHHGSGFSCGFIEATETYLYVAGEVTGFDDMPTEREMSSAVRAHYREVQEKQLASLAEQNRKDMAAEMNRVGVQAYVPRMNTHGVDSNLTRMEADVHKELSEEAGEANNTGTGAPGAKWEQTGAAGKKKAGKSNK